MERLKCKVIVLGAGISGLASAYKLSEFYRGQVIVLEKEDQIGGLCKTIGNNGYLYDLGSHRIHSNSNYKFYEMMRNIGLNNLIAKKRNGKLRFKKVYLDYPLDSVRIFIKIGFIELLLCLVSFVKQRIWNYFKQGYKHHNKNNYESYLVSKVGKRLYSLFYKPYAVKVWGGDPINISTHAAKKRVSMENPLSFLKNFLKHFFSNRVREGIYYYPPNGIGTIPLNLGKKVIESGSHIFTGIEDFSLNVKGGKKEVFFLKNNNGVNIEFDILVSTIPVEELVEKVSLNHEAIKSLRKIEWRGLKLVFLHIKGEPQKEGETFYFPELKYIFGRVSVPKRFSKGMQANNDCTSLICELPCREGDALWNAGGGRCLSFMFAPSSNSGDYKK